MKPETIETIIAKHPTINLVEFYKWKYRFIPIQLKLILRNKIKK